MSLPLHRFPIQIRTGPRRFRHQKFVHAYLGGHFTVRSLRPRRADSGQSSAVPVRGAAARRGRRHEEVRHARGASRARPEAVRAAGRRDHDVTTTRRTSGDGGIDGTCSGCADLRLSRSRRSSSGSRSISSGALPAAARTQFGDDPSAARFGDRLRARCSCDPD